MRIFKKTLLFASLIITLSGCTLPSRSTGVSVWIDVPSHNYSTTIKSQIHIEGHAAGSRPVESVEVLVNGELFEKITSLTKSGQLYHYETMWQPPSEGAFQIKVIAYMDNQIASEPDIAVVVVENQDEMIQPIVSETVLSLSSPTGTVTSTGMITRTVTPTLDITRTLTPTVTITPSRLPTRTHTSTLEPPDTTPPSAPSSLNPAGGKTLSCTAGVSLNWTVASDPSGVTEYRVEVQRSIDAVTWESVSGSPYTGISNPNLNINVECAWYYRWRVLAVDGVGNIGGYSDWAQFAVTIG